MNRYALRKNFTACFSDHEKTIRGKVAFKTKETFWLETQDPVIVLVSISSSFHEGVDGDLKMNALVSTIKSHVRGSITILFTDRAHVRTFSINFQNNLEKAHRESLNQAHALFNRYCSYFDACNVAYWSSYVTEDPSFVFFLNQLKKMYCIDPTFQKLLQMDTEASYKGNRILIYPDRALYFEKVKEDILEQCACLLVIAHKGYRFQFYPGSALACTEYVNRILNPHNQSITWIDVFLAIEKKTILPLRRD